MILNYSVGRTIVTVLITIFAGTLIAGSESGECSNDAIKLLCSSRTGDLQKLMKKQGSTEGTVVFTSNNRSCKFPLAGEKSFFKKACNLCGTDYYKVGPDTLLIQYGKAQYGKSIIYDIEKQYLQMVENESVDCAIDWQTHYAPLSLVGSALSYEVSDGGSSGCGPMDSYNMVVTTDIITKKSIAITELIDEKSLVSALKNDKFLREQSENQDSTAYVEFIKSFDKATSLDDLSPLLRMKYEFPLDSILCHYAFLDYDIDKNQVALRLILLNREVPTAVGFLQIGMQVQSRDGKKELFTKAKNGEGFFLGRYPNSLVRSKKGKK